MYSVVVLCVIIGATSHVTATANHYKHADDLFGADKVYSTEAKYTEEPRNMQMLITQIRVVYQAYVRYMFYIEIYDKYFHCISDRVMRTFLRRKSELSILVMTYMSIKNIEGDGQKLAIKIDNGINREMVVPVNKPFLPPAPSLGEIFKNWFKCMKYQIPPEDFLFYILEFQDYRLAPGLEDIHKAATE